MGKLSIKSSPSPEYSSFIRTLLQFCNMQRLWLPLTGRRDVLPTAAAAIVFLIVLLRTAWLGEDAFITFRTVDNFVNGYGLTWNTTERVQGFTNPLWMFLVSFFYFFSHEIFYTAILISVAISLLAVVLLIHQIAATRWSALLGVALLLSSRAFIDFSTSGLENPLTHAILVLFLAIYLRGNIEQKTLFWMCLLAALGTLNRMDTILFFAPPLVYAAWKTRDLKACCLSMAGFTPLILWEMFSLFYYGFLFPNTAYAKLNTGIPVFELAVQGLHYLLDSIQRDPLTLITAFIGIAVPLVMKTRWQIPVALGILLYLLYVVRVGGDFMSGRFLAAPFFVGTVIIAYNFRLDSTRRRYIALAAVLLLGFAWPYPPLLSGSDYGLGRNDLNGMRGVNDERGIYYQNAGLLKALEQAGEEEFPDHWYAARGREANRNSRSIIIKSGRYGAVEGFLVAPVTREEITVVTTWMNVGYACFYGGPQMHTIDAIALVEPLLARLPAREDPEWGPGHFSRIMPEGYIESHIHGKNLIVDKNLAVFYDKLCHITQGDLWDPKRWLEIWRMNWGKYEHLIDFEKYRHPSELDRRLSDTRIRPGDPSKYLELGAAYFKAGEPESAISALQQCLRLNPISFNNHYLAGNIYASNQQPELADQAYKQAIRLSSYLSGAKSIVDQDRLYKTYKRLAHAYDATGNRRGAIQATERALEIKPTAEIHYKLGLIYHKNGSLDQAIASFGRAIQLDPGNPGIYVDYGTALRASGRLNDAEQAYRHAIRLQPDQALFYHNLGGLELEQGDRAGALQAFQMADRLGSEQIETYLTLSRLYLGAGQPANAFTTYRRILRDFGVAEAEKSGVAGDLRTMITRGLHVAEAEAILARYWPDEPTKGS